MRLFIIMEIANTDLMINHGSWRKLSTTLRSEWQDLVIYVCVLNLIAHWNLTNTYKGGIDFEHWRYQQLSVLGQDKLPVIHPFASASDPLF
jgi:uncharacterized membrane protein